MLLGKNWKIESDELNVTLYQRFFNKSGKEYWKPYSYHPSINNALKRLVDIEVNRTGLKGVEMIVTKVKELHELIDQMPAKNVTISKEAVKTSRKGKSITPPKRPGENTAVIRGS